jgi:hypothetical protein
MQVVDQLHDQATLPAGKKRPVPLVSSIDGPHSLSGRRGNFREYNKMSIETVANSKRKV